MTSLEDHGRELVNRAGRVREAARERVLQELRELWGAIAGLREKIESEAGWLKGFWEKWERSFRNSVLPDPLPRLQPGPGAAIGALVGIALTWAWKEALRRLEPGYWPEAAPPTPSPPKEAPKTDKEALADVEKQIEEDNAKLNEQWVQQQAQGFRTNHPEDKPVDYPKAAGCVALVNCYMKEALGVPPASSWFGGNPDGEWNHPQAFAPDKWQKIPWNDLKDKGGLKVGDILFFNWGDGVGHVGVVTEVYGNGKFQVMDQSGYQHAGVVHVGDMSPTGGSSWADYKYQYNFWGVMRLNPPK
jgi:cell wall-associated NlpC family hydrolase